MICDCDSGLRLMYEKSTGHIKFHKFEDACLCVFGMQYKSGEVIVSQSELEESDFKGARWTINDDGSCNLKALPNMVLGFGRPEKPVQDTEVQHHGQ